MLSSKSSLPDAAGDNKSTKEGLDWDAVERVLTRSRAVREGRVPPRPQFGFGFQSVIEEGKLMGRGGTRPCQVTAVDVPNFCRIFGFQAGAGWLILAGISSILVHYSESIQMAQSRMQPLQISIKDPQPELRHHENKIIRVRPANHFMRLRAGATAPGHRGGQPLC